jgi:GNAT superfamily N-acetyltransferase
MIRIRPASPADAGAISRVLIRSIGQLCHADHGGDPHLIARWTANKAPASVARWIADRRCSLFLAERDGAPAGACSFSHDGRILLTYVDPDHRFCGVSRAMLGQMEGALALRGIARAVLGSTETAHRFYLSAGWRDAGPPGIVCGMPDHPMEKTLAAAPARQG